MIASLEPRRPSWAWRFVAEMVRGWASLAAWFAPRPLALSGVVLMVAIGLVMGRLVVERRFVLANDIWTSDLLNCNLPPRVFLGHELRAGRFPLWMPGAFGGLPLIAQGEGAALNPFTWIFFGVFDWITATNLSLVLHSFIAGFGTVLLARRIGARTAPAIVAGLAFMLSGFLVEHVKHLNMHHAATWVPLLAYAADRMIQRPTPRRAALLGIVGALQLTEGHPQITYLALYVLLPVFVFRLLVTRPWRPHGLGRYLGRLAVAGGASVLMLLTLAGAYIAAGAELLSLTERWAERSSRWDFATHYEFIRANLITLFWANPFGDGADATFNPSYGFFWESWLYVGVVPCLGVVLAILVVLVHPFRRTTGFTHAALFVALGCLSIPLMMGKRSPYYAKAFDILPGLPLFRFHHRFALVLIFAVVMLAAIGLTAALRVLERWLGGRAATITGALLVLVSIGDLTFFMTRHFFGAPGRLMLHPETVARIQARAPHEPFRIYSVFTGETHGEAFDAAKGWAKNYQPYVDHLPLLQQADNAIWDLESMAGYASLVPYDVAVVTGTQNVGGTLTGAATHWAKRRQGCEGKDLKYSGPCSAALKCSNQMARLFGAFNVRFLITPGPVEECQGWKTVDVVPSGMFTVYISENQQFLPRAYVVDQARTMRDVPAAANELSSPSFNPTREVLRVGAPPKDAPPPPRATSEARPCTYKSDGPGWARIGCQLDRPGYLVVAETRYPGRTVTVDGKVVESFAANGDQLGVRIEAGTHDVRIGYTPRYRPLVWLAMLGWTGIVLTAGVLALPKPWRRRLNVRAWFPRRTARRVALSPTPLKRKGIDDGVEQVSSLHDL